MAVSGVGHHAYQHIRDDFQQQSTQSTTSNRATGRSAGDPDRDSGAHFDSHHTPSNSSGGQDSQAIAGTYQVSQVQLFSAAALVLLAGSSSTQNTQAPVADSPVPTQTAPAVPQPSQLDSADPVSPTAVPSAGALTAPVTAPSTAPSTAPQVTTGDPTSSAQDPLQALNDSLQSLGLSRQQIQAFDQVASFIQSVSPQAFADLVSQLQNLAQQTAAGVQSPTGAVAADSTAATGVANDSTPGLPIAGPASTTVGSIAPSANPTVPTGTYQIEELSIKFSAIDVQGNTASTNGNGGNTTGTFDLSSFNLSIQEVKVTLTDGNGQSAQITAAPLPATSESSTGQTSISSGAAAA